MEISAIGDVTKPGPSATRSEPGGRRPGGSATRVLAVDDEPGLAVHDRGNERISAPVPLPLIRVAGQA